MKIFSILMAVYFTVGACLPRCDFSQLLKLHDLVEHYELHKATALETGASFDVLDFLFDHFIEHDNHDHEDESEHDNLPFQSLSSLNFSLIYLAQAEVEPLSSDMDENELLTAQSSMKELELVSEIFHPPLV